MWGWLKFFTTLHVSGNDCESHMRVDVGLQTNFSQKVSLQLWNSWVMSINYISYKQRYFLGSVQGSCVGNLIWVQYSQFHQLIQNRPEQELFVPSLEFSPALRDLGTAGSPEDLWLDKLPSRADRSSVDLDPLLESFHLWTRWEWASLPASSLLHPAHSGPLPAAPGSRSSSPNQDCPHSPSHSFMGPCIVVVVHRPVGWHCPESGPWTLVAGRVLGTHRCLGMFVAWVVKVLFFLNTGTLENCPVWVAWGLQSSGLILPPPPCPLQGFLFTTLEMHSFCGGRSREGEEQRGQRADLGVGEEGQGRLLSGLCPWDYPLLHSQPSAAPDPPAIPSPLLFPKSVLSCHHRCEVVSPCVLRGGLSPLRIQHFLVIFLFLPLERRHMFMTKCSLAPPQASLLPASLSPWEALGHSQLPWSHTSSHCVYNVRFILHFDFLSKDFFGVIVLLRYNSHST